MVSDHNFYQSPSLEILFVRGRYINIAMILTFLNLHLIPPVARNTLDFLFVGRMNRQSINLLINEFISGDISKKEFLKFIINILKIINN